MRRHPPGSPPPFALFPAAIATFFLVLPIAGIISRMPWSTLDELLRSSKLTEPLRLSILVSVSATVLTVILGVPLALVLARMEFRGRNVLRAAILLPLVLPPVVGGTALFFALGRRGLLGGALGAMGIQLPFTTAGAVVAATFVAMPFLVISVEGSLRAMSTDLEAAAATLGARRSTQLLLVTLPRIRTSIAAGAALAWARALGEFGATITFAGNQPGRTQTLPLAVYLSFQTDPEAALALSLVLLTVSVGVLVILRNHLVGR